MSSLVLLMCVILALEQIGDGLDEKKCGSFVWIAACMAATYDIITLLK